MSRFVLEEEPITQTGRFVMGEDTEPPPPSRKVAQPAVATPQAVLPSAPSAVAHNEVLAKSLADSLGVEVADLPGARSATTPVVAPTVTPPPLEPQTLRGMSRVGAMGRQPTTAADTVRSVIRGALWRPQEAGPEPISRRLNRSFAADVLSIPAGFANVASWLTAGNEAVKSVESVLEAIAEEVRPPDQSYVEKVVSALGSVVGFGIPALGVARALSSVARVAPALAGWVAPWSAAVMEAGVEAGNSFKEVLGLTKNRQAAEEAARANFALNVGVIALTNKLGIFGEAGHKLRKALFGFAMEGSQEALQQVAQQWPSGRTFDADAVKEVLEAGSIGALIGGGIGAVTGTRGRYTAEKLEGILTPPETIAQPVRRQDRGTAGRVAAVKERAQAPAAAPATVPEAPDTVAAQTESMLSGDKPAVLLPPGTRAVETEQGTVIYDPAQVAQGPDEIRSAIETGRGGEILGYGVAEKPAEGEPAAVVESKAPDGTEVQSVVSPVPVPEAVIASAERVTPEGGTVEVTPPERAEERAAEIVSQRQRGRVAPAAPAAPVVAEQAQVATEVPAETETPVPAAPGPSADIVQATPQAVAEQAQPKPENLLAKMPFSELSAESDAWQEKINARHDALDKQGVPFAEQMHDPEVSKLYADRIKYDTAAAQRGYNGARAILDEELGDLPESSLYASRDGILRDIYSLTDQPSGGAYFLAKYTSRAMQNTQETTRKLAEKIAPLILAKENPIADYWMTMESSASGIGRAGKARIIAEATRRAEKIQKRLMGFFFAEQQPERAVAEAARTTEVPAPRYQIEPETPTTEPAKEVVPEDPEVERLARKWVQAHTPGVGDPLDVAVVAAEVNRLPLETRKKIKERSEELSRKPAMPAPEAPAPEPPAEVEQETPRYQMEPEAPEPTTVPSEKEPWEMTREEYEGSHNAKDLSASGWIVPKSSGKDTDWYWWDSRPVGHAASSAKRATGRDLILLRHKRSVKIAVERGLPVPPEVLADYPDLKAAVEKEKPAPKEEAAPSEAQAEIDRLRAENERMKTEQAAPAASIPEQIRRLSLERGVDSQLYTSAVDLIRRAGGSTEGKSLNQLAGLVRRMIPSKRLGALKEVFIPKFRELADAGIIEQSWDSNGEPIYRLPSNARTAQVSAGSRQRGRKPKPTPSQSTTETPIGQNAAGQDIFVDDRGARYIVVDAVKQTQPGKRGPDGGYLAKDTAELYGLGKTQFLTAGEVEGFAGKPNNNIAEAISTATQEVGEADAFDRLVNNPSAYGLGKIETTRTNIQGPGGSVARGYAVTYQVNRGVGLTKSRALREAFHAAGVDVYSAVSEGLRRRESATTEEATTPEPARKSWIGEEGTERQEATEYTQPEGIEASRTVLKKADTSGKPYFVLQDVRNGVTVGNRYQTFDEAKEVADKENLRVQQAKAIMRRRGAEPPPAPTKPPRSMRGRKKAVAATPPTAAEPESVGIDSTLTGETLAVGEDDALVLDAMQERAEGTKSEPLQGKKTFLREEGQATVAGGIRTGKPKWMEITDNDGQPTGEYYEYPETLKVLQAMQSGKFPQTARRKRLADQILWSLKNDADQEKARAYHLQQAVRSSEEQATRDAAIEERLFAEMDRIIAEEETAAPGPEPAPPAAQTAQAQRSAALGSGPQGEMFSGGQTIGSAIKPGKKGTTVPQVETGDELLSGFRRPEPERQTTLPAAEAPKPSEPSPAFGSTNTVFTQDRADAARETLRKKLNQLNVGLDLEMVQAGIELAGFYIEGGVRRFADFSARMVEDMGESVRPHLKSWYLAARNSPGMDTTGMDSEAEIDQASQGPGAMSVTEGQPVTPFVTSTKNAVKDAEREARGLMRIPRPAKFTNQAAWDKALKAIEDDPGIQDALIEDLTLKARALTPVENALLLHRSVSLQNEQHDLANQLFSAVERGFEDRASQLQRQTEDLGEDLIALDEVLRAAGTESGRSLQARKMLATQDYSLEAMELRKRIAQGGEPLSKEEREELKRLSDRIKDLEEKLEAHEAAAQARAAKERAEEAVRDMVERVGKEAQGVSVEPGSKEEPANRGRGRKPRPRKDPEATRKAILAGMEKANTETALEDMRPWIQRLAETFVRQGITTRDPLVDAVHAVLKPIFPEITRRQTMDAISGFGDFSPLNPDPVKATLRDLKGQMQQVAKLEQIAAGKPIPKTGPERRTPSDEERRLIQMVEEAKRRYGVVVTDPETQLKSALDALKTRLRHEISDLEYQVATGTKIVRGKSATITDAEVESLRAERDAARERFDAVFGKPGLTPEQLTERAIAAAERSIAELERRIASKDIAPRSVVSRTPVTPELSALKSREAALREQLQELRDIDGALQEQRRLKELERQLSDYLERIKAKDFAPHAAGAKVPDTPAIREATARRDAARDALEELKAQSGYHDAQRIKQATDALEKSNEDLRRRINTHDLSVQKVGTTAPDTPELKLLRAEHKALSDIVREMRQAEKPKKSPDEIALQALKTRMLHRIAEMESRLESQDFTPPTKAERQEDEETRRIRIELDKIQREFNHGLIRDKLARRTRAQKILAGFGEALNTSRILMTSFDLSAVLRQGGILAYAHPILAAKAVPDMLRAIRSEDVQRASDMEIHSRPNAPLYRRAKLYFSEQEGTLAQMEEAYMSRWAQKIPGIGASQRAFVTFLNRLRADSFDLMLSGLSRTKSPTAEEAKAVANFINVATGRGRIGKSESGTVGLNHVFFSPRYLASRVMLLSGQPLYHGSMRSRALIAKEYGRSLAGAAVVFSLALAAGGSIDRDWRSAGFLRVRFGNTYLDPLGGLLQLVTLAGRLWTGETKTAQGRVRKLRGPGTGFGYDMGDVLLTFLRSKLAPNTAAIVDAALGKDVIGRPVTKESILWRSANPIAVSDVLEAVQDLGVPKGSALGVLSLLGMGINTRDNESRKIPHQTPIEKSVKSTWRSLRGSPGPQPEQRYTPTQPTWAR